MSPDSPAGKAAADLARRIRAMGEPGADEDPDTLATRWVGDLIARGGKLPHDAPRRPEIDPFTRKAGTPPTAAFREAAAQVRAQLARSKPQGGDAA